MIGQRRQSAPLRTPQSMSDCRPRTVNRASGNGTPNADYSLPAGPCWPAVEARRLFIPAAAGRQWAPHAGVISPHFLLPLGYEHYDIRLPGLCTVLVRPTDQPSLPAAGAWLEGVSGVSTSLGSKPASRSGSWPGQPGAWALLPTPCPASDSTVPRLRGILRIPPLRMRARLQCHQVRSRSSVAGVDRRGGYGRSPELPLWQCWPEW